MARDISERHGLKDIWSQAGHQAYWNGTPRAQNPCDGTQQSAWDLGWLVAAYQEVREWVPESLLVHSTLWPLSRPHLELLVELGHAGHRLHQARSVLQELSLREDLGVSHGRALEIVLAETLRPEALPPGRPLSG